MAMSINTKNTILNNWFRNEVYDFPNTLYIGLSFNVPTSTGGNISEPTASSYERLAVPASSSVWGVASDGQIDNSVALRFGEATDSWSTQASPLRGWAIFDSAIGGNMLFYGALAHDQQIPSGAILEIPAHGLLTAITD